MSIFSDLYLKTSKARFKRTFRPTRLRQNGELLVHTGSKLQFMKSILLIHMLRKTGNIVLVSPLDCSEIVNILNIKFQQVFYYEKPLKALSPEHNKLIRSLANIRFDFLVELGNPANTSLPYLSRIDQRICFGSRNILPYYNIIFENHDALIGYFNLKARPTSKLFSLSKSSIKEIKTRYKLKTDYVVINTSREIKSDYDKFIIGKDIDAQNAEIYAIIMASRGYSGEPDHFAEFARLNKIAVID